MEVVELHYYRPLKPRKHTWKSPKRSVCMLWPCGDATFTTVWSDWSHTDVSRLSASSVCQCGQSKLTHWCLGTIMCDQSVMQETTASSHSQKHSQKDIQQLTHNKQRPLTSLVLRKKSTPHHQHNGDGLCCSHCCSLLDDIITAECLFTLDWVHPWLMKTASK